MGYYSNVAIAARERAAAILSDVINAENVKPSIVYKNSEKITVFVWNYIKWDTAYSDIKKIVQKLRELDEYEEEEYSYHFIRIGEAIGDYNEESNNWTLDVIRPMAVIDIDNDFKEVQ